VLLESPRTLSQSRMVLAVSFHTGSGFKYILAKHLTLNDDRSSCRPLPSRMLAGRTRYSWSRISNSAGPDSIDSVTRHNAASAE
jgi:hypothetical protein